MRCSKECGSREKRCGHWWYMFDVMQQLSGGAHDSIGPRHLSAYNTKGKDHLMKIDKNSPWLCERAYTTHALTHSRRQMISIYQSELIKSRVGNSLSFGHYGEMGRICDINTLGSWKMVELSRNSICVGCWRQMRAHQLSLFPWSLAEENTELYTSAKTNSYKCFSFSQQMSSLHSLENRAISLSKFQGSKKTLELHINSMKAFFSLANWNIDICWACLTQKSISQLKENVRTSIVNKF